jgi:hypothetical protein
MDATGEDGGAMKAWLLSWWQCLPSWAAIIIGVLAVSMAAATVVVGAAMVGAFLLTRWWFWVLLAVAVGLYLIALWISNSEDDE